ncbi:MAG: UV DNA damage repair endonuclease UvsE, partial [Candidatus Omnitrophica bacterium]|nr:UV DNA damage repair endonuclease UvsE [Candidatus Omnitrophota bacterium]
RGNKTFRLKSYSKKRFIETVENNIACLLEVLKFNAEHKIFFFRISSDIVPFASHPVCKFKWQSYFKSELCKIGNFIKNNNIRISMHPDQFNVVNSKNPVILQRTARELLYHAQLLDVMKLDLTAKIQIHIGGVYGDKENSLKRFMHNYKTLDAQVKKRLVIENDDRSYNLSDCLQINKSLKIPVLFDVFHHSINSSGQNIQEALNLASETWQKKDGLLMIDYSQQQPGGRPGVHIESLEPKVFRSFLRYAGNLDFDIMLEIKDKEKSVFKALDILKKTGGFSYEQKR